MMAIRRRIISSIAAFMPQIFKKVIYALLSTHTPTEVGFSLRLFFGGRQICFKAYCLMSWHGSLVTKYATIQLNKK